MRLGRTLTTAVVLSALIATSYPAQAFDTNGRIGLGYDADLNGVSLRYFFQRLGIDLTVGFALETARSEGEEASIDLIIAPKLVYPFKLHDKVNLNVEGGTFVQVLGSHSDDATDLSFGIFGGLAPELLLWDHLAVEIFFGMSLNINNVLEKQAPKLNISFGTLGEQLSIVSGAAFHYYF